MKNIVVLVSVLFITASGGNSGGGGTGTDTAGVEDNGCTQEFYQTILGRYTGEITLNEDQTSNFPRVCQWASSVEISGESVLARCLLRTSTSGTVVQSTFYPDDIVYRYQCKADEGERTVREPIGDTFPATDLPGLDNSYFPIDVSFSKNDSEDRGPYFGDENVNTAYVYLYDGVQADLVEQITINGDGTITMRDTNGVLLGTLVKE